MVTPSWTRNDAACARNPLSPKGYGELGPFAALAFLDDG